MSRQQTHTLCCPHCTTEQPVQVYSSIHAQRAAHVRQQILAGTLHRVRCGGCGEWLQLELRFGYLDEQRRHWVAVFPPEERAQAPRCEAMATGGFWQASQGAPLWWTDIALTTRLRVVFGVQRLTEKLLIWERGLDDGVLAVLLHQLGIPEARVVRVDEQVIELATEPGPASVSRRRYAVLASQRPALTERHPELFRQPWVHPSRA